MADRAKKRPRGRAVAPPAVSASQAAPTRELSDDDSERAMARLFALGLPLVGLSAALVLGALRGLAPALLVLAGTALLGTIGFLWASLRTISGDAPLDAGVAAHAHVSRVATPDRKREVLRALKDLELEHAMGKIDDADFGELEARYRGQAKALMREMDAGLAPRRAEAEKLVERHLANRNLLLAEPTPLADDVDDDAAPADAMPARDNPRLPCPKCETSNEPDAAFCKKCGSQLAADPLAAEDASDAAV